ncbi:MAG: type II toxin-antitoxin system Phd/YefM family antitoxin, partial [Pseudomonadota bacterium]|nr:type II toxin-antitoxin system Phd/YefM family antitoxin [Pseudomonadota bacterium]
MDISATDFKAKCLKLLDDVARTHEPVVVTKRGKPIAKVVP